MSNLNEILAKPYIPKQDSAYTEFLDIDIANKGHKQIKINVPAKPTLPHEVDMWETINKFETEAWSPKRAGLDTGWESINKAFDGGIKPGFIMIAADSNVGKM